MSTPERPPGPASLVAAAAALGTIDEALSGAGSSPAEESAEAAPPSKATDSEQALAALLLLRRLRDQLAEWEPALIETARSAGASWADLAHPLGVASRQAAERRYLRIRPGKPGNTGEQRVQDTRDRRAADRAVSVWARGNAADLRQLAGQIAALAELPTEARGPLAQALALDDPARLVAPLAATRPYVATHDAALTDRLDALTRHTEELRSTTRRRAAES